MKFNKCIVFYEEWQYHCCGEDFKVGDEVCWTASPNDKNGYTYKIENKSGKIKKLHYDYSYEGCAGGVGKLIGRVYKIKLLSTDKNDVNHIVKEIDNAKECIDCVEETYSLMIVELINYQYIDFDFENRYISSIVINDETSKLEIDLAKAIKKMGFNIVVSTKQDCDEVKKPIREVRSFSNVFVFNNNIKDGISKFVEFANYEFHTNEVWINIVGEKDKDISNELIDYFKEYLITAVVFNIKLLKDKTEMYITEVKCVNDELYQNIFNLKKGEWEKIMGSFQDKYTIESTDNNDIIKVVEEFIKERY